MTPGSLLTHFISVPQRLQQNLRILLSCHGLSKLGADIFCPSEPPITPHHFARLPDWVLSLEMVCFHDVFQCYADLASRSLILLRFYVVFCGFISLNHFGSTCFDLVESASLKCPRYGLMWFDSYL